MKKFPPLDWELRDFDWNALINPLRPNRLDSVDALLNELDLMQLEITAGSDSWRLLFTVRLQ